MNLTPETLITYDASIDVVRVVGSRFIESIHRIL